jgi:hypothetical protein
MTVILKFVTPVIFGEKTRMTPLISSGRNLENRRLKLPVSDPPEKIYAGVQEYVAATIILLPKVEVAQ